MIQFYSSTMNMYPLKAQKWRFIAIMKKTITIHHLPSCKLKFFNLSVIAKIVSSSLNSVRLWAFLQIDSLEMMLE